MAEPRIVTITLSSAGEALINKLEQRVGKPTNSIFADAILFYEALLTEHENGVVFYTKNDKDEFVSYTMFEEEEVEDGKLTDG